MPKVHVQRGPVRVPRAVRFGRTSVVYTIVYVLYLSLIPFKAYMTEPFPWQLPPLSSLPLNVDASFDVFANTTATYLTSLYNHATVPRGVVFSKHVNTTNSFVLRFTLALPRDGDTHCGDYMSYFPGAVFYSQGMAAFVCGFVARNTSMRLHDPLFQCLQDTFVGIRTAVSCTWLEPSSASNSTYDVYHAVQLLESPWVSWVNFSVRCGLFGYIVHLLWHLYYCHYGPLAQNLRVLGLSQTSNHDYQIQLGDPTWLILSHPFVSLVMVVDCLVNSYYGGAANSRTSQLTDMGEFSLGCLYGSRIVWVAYAFMRALTFWIRRYHWDSYFEPVDPGLLALAASFYSGPIMYLFSRTSHVWAYQWLQASLVPPAQRTQRTENFPLILIFYIMMAGVPLLHSIVGQALHRYRHPHATSTFATRTPDTFASRRFNDWKHWLLFLRWPRGHDGAIKEGGTLYHLFDTNPRYRKFPLFSTRGSDCFVLCVDANTGSIVRQVRLSLIYAMDPQTTCPSLAIPICPHDHPTCAVCTLEVSPGCDPSKQASPSAKCLHLGANDCQWMK
ncbi:Aste57867_14664 [Aphanomyces stellatus]|uniref:Aste57867_14664 protein n=1 Tax=Aphanomyces stellatus TaxID=120398 RepID=A0A485L1U4_9STRA|nr:hypothetical protein As57867_014609 [Aphanomyces stellatus]VFT91482.1 Aste57867_14664 [Aphanomyces stellatus]